VKDRVGTIAGGGSVCSRSGIVSRIDAIVDLDVNIDTYVRASIQTRRAAMRDRCSRPSDISRCGSTQLSPGPSMYTQVFIEASSPATPSLGTRAAGNQGTATRGVQRRRKYRRVRQSRRFFRRTVAAISRLVSST
jgi:hypothetical protein